MANPKRGIPDALDLPSDRVDVLTAMPDSLDRIDLGEDWEAEIRRRIDEVDSGQMRTMPGDQVFSRIDHRLRAR